MPESPESPPTPLRSVDPENTVDALEQEIRTRNNPEEVGQRLAATAYKVRREAFTALSDLAQRFTDRPDTVRRLLAGSRTTWGCAHFSLARTFHEKGEEQMALQLYDELTQTIMADAQDAKALREAAETGVMLGREECATEVTDLLFALIDRDSSVLPEIVSLAYIFARSNRPADAASVWERLRGARPDDRGVLKAHMRFMKERPKAPTESSREDPHRRGAVKELTDYSSQTEMLRECEARLAQSSDDAMVAFWMNAARVLVERHNNIVAANRIWTIILKHAPRHAFSFLRFSREFNALGQYPEVDILIRHAHSLAPEFKKPINKGKRVALKSTSVANTEALDAVISIDALPQTAHQWLTQAGQLVTAQDFATAFRIWTALLQQNPRLTPAITRGLIRIATELPPERAFTELRVEETIRAVPVAVNLYRSVAANIAESQPVLARHILYALHETKPDDPGNTLILADFLMKQRRYDEAAQIWLPLRASHASGCARCASFLARHRQHALARRLFVEVAKVSPVALIRHGYEYFRDPAAVDVVLECIGPILPTGSEKRLEEHQKLALKLHVRHGARSEQLRVLFSRLVDSGALSPREAERILATPRVLQSQQVKEERDAEIESYLQRTMPDLQRGSFFRRMRETQPHIRPGKKTSRTARSVVLHPYRLYTQDSLDPKKHKKGRKEKPRSP